MATEYQDEFDQERLASLQPYQVKEGTMTREQIASMVNINFHAAYGPDFESKIAAHVTIDPVSYYQDLLQSILTMPNMRFANIHDAIASPPTGDEIVCTIRHDLDGDLIAARQQAEIENKLGISTSYYLLHTAPYYSILQDGVFMRNSVSVADYLYIQGLGHEMALHTDGMTLYQSHKIDGACGVRTELAWLREKGCSIKGTTAHNSFGVYGCNNYSIFRGRPLGMSTPGGPKGVIHNGNWAPLQVLDEKELGLEYEANDLFWQDEVPVLYGCLMTQNNWYIAENQYGLLSPETRAERPPLRARFGTHHDMLDAIADVRGPHYVKLVVHPMHYGLRGGPDEAPWHAVSPTDEQRDRCRLWAGGGINGDVISSAITCLNEFETPDRGMSTYKTGDFRIVVHGGSNISTHTVSTDSKYSQVASRLIRGPIRKPLATALGIARATSSMAEIRADHEVVVKEAAPDVIIVGIDMDGDDAGDRISWANEISEQGSFCICVVESGAKSEENRDKLNKSISCRVVDPTDAFSAYEGRSPLVWDDNPKLWTPQAHAIVGELVSRVLIEAFKPVS